MSKVVYTFDVMNGEGRVYKTRSVGRKHKAMIISDPTMEWHAMLVKVLEKNENVLYPDERSMSAFFKLCIKYGDACVQAINRQRFAADKRSLSIAEKKAKALKDLEEDL